MARMESRGVRAAKTVPSLGTVPRWRVWVTPEEKRRLEWALKASVLVAFLACVWAFMHPMAAALPLLVLGLSLGVAAGLLVASRVASPESFCAMCRQPRSRVRALVAGSAATVCTDCAPLTVSLIDGGPPGPGVLGALSTVLDSAVNDLEPRAPREVSGRFLAAAAALQSEPEALRAVARKARRLSNPAAVLEALGRIPLERRTVEDAIDASVALGELERYAEARAELERLDDASLSPVSRGLRLNNLAWFALKEDPELSGEALAQVRALAEEGGRLLLEEAPADVRDTYRPHVHGTWAALALRAGKPRVALSMLEAVEAQGGKLQAAQWLLRGDALAASGHALGARAAWGRALELGHPEELTVRQARERLREG